MQMRVNVPYIEEHIYCCTKYLSFSGLCSPLGLLTIAKCWKQPKCPSANEWIKQLRYIYTMEDYTAERKKELLPFATAWMVLENIMLSEISQAVKDKYHMILPISGT